MVTLPNGIDYAVCHVRGGGELGEAWRLGGKDCEQAQHLARPDRLRRAAHRRRLYAQGHAVHPRRLGRRDHHGPGDGGAAGPVRRASSTWFPRPTPIRAEFSPNGPPNIPEFGTIKNEQGFKNLLAMDSVAEREAGRQISADHDLDGPQRSAGVELGAGEARGDAARVRANRRRCCCGSTRRPATALDRPRPRPTNSTRTSRPSSCGSRASRRRERTASAARGSRGLVALDFGAGEGNRTLVVSLGSFCSAIELRPLRRPLS